MGRKKIEENKLYFGVEQEEAVLIFLSSEDNEERQRIFRDVLSEPLNKMAESIIKRYRLMRDDIDIDDLKNDTLSFLITKADKFKPERNKKAYSYFGTICRNYLKGQLVKYSKNISRYLPYDSTLDEDNRFSYEIEIENKIEAYDFIPIIADRIDEEMLKNTKLKPNDLKVGIAIVDLLRNWESFIDPQDSSNILNRNKVLYYIRESTFLSVKDVRNSLKKYKTLYAIFKDEYIK